MSQYIFNSPDMKARLLKGEGDWFVGEYKTPTMQIWFPWIAGTAKWLCLTTQDKEWAK